MPHIHTRQARSFLAVDNTLYKRRPPLQLMPYMVRMSSSIRSTSMQHRSGAIKMVQAPMYEAWATIHRYMRPYFFTPIDDVISGYQGQPMELPDLAEAPHIHEAMHFCLDVLTDLDRLIMLLQSDPDVEDEEAAEKIFSCWNAMYRATARCQGLENRIKSGKAFNGGA